MHDVILAIDPDCTKDGLAILITETRRLTARQAEFGDTLNTINSLWVNAQAQGRTFVVLIEAGWLNKGNYHLHPLDTQASAAAKGMSQGRNHQRGLDIVDYCKYNHVPHELIKPLAKTIGRTYLWSGTDGKITQAELEAVTGQKLGRLNQEGRDAALIAWIYAGLPLKRVRSKPTGLPGKS